MTLATGGLDWRIHLWDVRSGQQTAALLGHTNTVAGLAFSTDGRTLASGGWDGAVKLWNVESARDVMTLEGHSGPVRCLAFSSDGRCLATAGSTPAGGGEVFLWRTAHARDAPAGLGVLRRQP